MCMEDIRIGRKLTVVPNLVPHVAATLTLMFPADSTRVGVSAAVGGPQGGLLAGETIAIGTRFSGALVPLFTLTFEKQSDYAGVDKFGSLVTGTLYFWSTATTVVTIPVALIRLDKE